VFQKRTILDIVHVILEVCVQYENCCLFQQSLELRTQERLEAEVEERISQERTQWKTAADKMRTEEIQAALEQARREWEDNHEENVQKIRDGMEESIQERVAAEVSLVDF
jgi:hypothetical protein